jgi:D-alanyl-D-alanine carboxypeptidase/D-alanyl-D-alanine-endopeptidase (penicillin-binding protein 4)
MRRLVLTWGAVAMMVGAGSAGAAPIGGAPAAAAPLGAAPARAADHGARLAAYASQSPAAAAPRVALPAAHAAQSPAAQRTLTKALNGGMGQIGGASSAYVVDLNTGQALYSAAASVARMPASVEKIYTTSTALLRFGPNATLATAVLGAGRIDAHGTYHGTLYLKGGGDPTFGSTGFDSSAYGTGATVQHLVSNLIQSLHIKAVSGRIVGDESYFDSLRGTPPTGFAADLPDIEGELSGLAFDRGFANFDGTLGQPRPALFAAQQLVSALRARGVRVPSRTRVSTGTTPASALRLATVHSPSIATLIHLTNTPSDNYLAEMLLKGLGARFGGAGRTAAGAAVVRSELVDQFGIGPQLQDGSGLSRADRTSPHQLVTVLSQMYANAAFFNSLAIAGRTGTLKHYAHGTSAQGNCHAKTGTLSDVANLAGYCRARDGHELAFAFLANGIGSPLAVHTVEANQMAPALASYDG